MDRDGPDSQDTEASAKFHYIVGGIARFLLSIRHPEILLTSTQLLLAGSDGHGEAVLPEEIIPPILLNNGWIWSTVHLELHDGRSVSLAGVGNYEARILVQALDTWIAPARARFFASVEGELSTAEGRMNAVLNGERYVRQSDIRRVGEELGTWIKQIDAQLKAPDRPDALRARFTLLHQQLVNLTALVAGANERFVADALVEHGELFDTIESKPLTPAQRRACVINDDHNLVLAGAGTGKTSVMIGRVGYLLTAGLAEPDSVLMLAYNRKAAEEMQERADARLAGIPGAAALTIKTFHALGVEILAEVDGRKPSLTAMATDEGEFKGFITTLLDEALRDPAYAAKFIEYGFDLHQPHRSLFDYRSMEEYERELGRLQLTTLQGERVKSHEELRIANFLARNGVEYAYEQPFVLDTADRHHRQYRPDFTITREGPDLGPLFLEHFGVDARGNPPSFFGEEQAKRYREGMEWKRAIYREHGLPFIETFSYQFRPEVVFDRLTEQLAPHGVALRPRSDAECLDLLRGSHIVTETAALFAGLVPIIREYGTEHVEIGRRIAGLAEHERARAHLLWELLQPIVVAYERHLAAAGEIDFADMIARAADLVGSGRYRSPFTHILVDEFQDISGPRARLVLALARQRPEATVFCVGDDWQAIYRFAGSDVRYTSEFERLIGPGTTTALDRTFRFNDQIGRVAAEFVTKNPAQMRKTIESVRTVAKPAVSLVPTAEPHRGLEAILRRVDGFGQAKGERLSVYVLARYQHELAPLRAHVRSLGKGRFPNVGEVEFRTVHSVKGREADIVVVTGLEEGRNGFPADKATDTFHELFLPPKESFEFADERRLFYVALTRAKHRVYLLFDAVSHSPFVRELRAGGYAIEEAEFKGDFIQSVLPVVPCPRCTTGEIRPRSGPHGQFFGCHRFPACRYRERGCGTCQGLLLRVGRYRVCSNSRCNGVHLECPKCSSPMEHRSGPYGPFFGCSKYGRVDVLEQCAATERWRQLPSAAELRARV
jgi:DNA helicase-4